MAKDLLIKIEGLHQASREKIAFGYLLTEAILKTQQPAVLCVARVISEMLGLMVNVDVQTLEINAKWQEMSANETMEQSGTEDAKDA